MIEKYIKKISKYTAVYWAAPTSRADGSNQYATPVEIKCFWKGGTQFIPDRDALEVSAKAIVYVFEDLDEQGMLYLGKLTDLTTAQKADPRKVSRAYVINKFEKIPALTTGYNRHAIIGPETSRIPPGIERQ